jgi:hypothetical protein
MMKKVSTAILLMLIGSRLLIAAQAPTTPLTLWSETVLEDLSGARKRSLFPFIDSGQAGILFQNRERLIAYEEVFDPSQFGSARPGEPSSSYRLTVSIIDANSGRALVSKSWPTRAHESSVQALSDSILIQTGKILRVFSKDFEESKRINLPPTNGDDDWIVTVSPDGRSLLVNRYDDRHSHFDLLNGRTLELRFSWDERPPLRRLYSISDKKIAAADFNQQNIIYGQLGTGKWAKLGNKTMIGCIGLPTLINDLWLATGCDSVNLFSTNAQILMIDHLAKNEQLQRKIAVAKDEGYIAVCITQTKGTDFWDTGKIRAVGMRFAVYDLSRRMRILNVDVKKLPSSDCDYALSPDGSMLAILNDRNVSVYRVSERVANP